ncbi:hypothetical protein FKP32DRAFT_1558023, partial [Trametes sanguinea]
PKCVHPAAPDFPHEVDEWITVVDDNENVLRVCTMVSCPACGIAVPADKAFEHYYNHTHAVGNGTVCGWTEKGGSPCKHTFNTKNTLKRHIEGVHLKIVIRHCRYCHKEHRSDVKKHPSARSCSERAKALAGLGSSRQMRDRCVEWCGHLRGRESLPQVDTSHPYKARIIGPRVPVA